MSLSRARELSRKSRQLLQSLEQLKDVAGLTQGQIENVKDYSDQCHRNMETAFLDEMAGHNPSHGDTSLIDKIISGIGVIQYARRQRSDRINRQFRD